MDPSDKPSVAHVYAVEMALAWETHRRQWLNNGLVHIIQPWNIVWLDAFRICGIKGLVEVKKPTLCFLLFLVILLQYILIDWRRIAVNGI